MAALPDSILEKLIAGFAEPLLVARIDSNEWPVVLVNPAFEFAYTAQSVIDKPLADVIEGLAGRELAVEVSEVVRSRQEMTMPIEMRGREYSLVMMPIEFERDSSQSYFAAYWRAGGATVGPVDDGDMQQALRRAKRRIRDLSRDDPVTGLLNEAAFREILTHDWAVAERDKSSLALVCFTLDNFGAYRDVFGRHATDTCIRRVAQAIKRFLRRASDVAARIGDDKLIVLSHSSEKAGAEEFAERIATAVRNLGLHHPRSETEKFVTVSYRVRLTKEGAKRKSADSFLRNAIK